MRNTLVGVVIACGLLLAPRGAQSAVADTVFIAPLELSADFAIIRIMQLQAGARSFMRTDFPYAGTFLRLTVKANRNPSAGDAWITKLQLQHPDLGTVDLGTATISYDAGLDCLLFNNSALFCGVFVPPDSNVIKDYDVISYFDAQCAPLEDFQLKPYSYRFAGRVATAGAGGTLGDFPFAPTEFPLGVPQFDVLASELYPDIPGVATPPTQTVMQLQALDGIVRPSGGNCGQPLAGVPVTLTATVVPQTGSHLHFTSAAEPAKGKFIEIPFALPPQTVSPDGTMLTSSTDGFGSLAAAYGAGLYGVRESVRAEADDLTYGGTKESIDEMTTRVAGLVPLDTTSALYTLRGGFAAPCDTGHNDTGTQRRSHYVTPPMRDFIGTLAGRFYRFEGVKLSLNDASLQFGGFFDDGIGSAQCHASHRYGIDIDVNETSPDYAPCVGGSGLKCAATHPAFVGMSRRAALEVIAKELKAKPIIEPTIHYRMTSAAN